MLPIRTGSADVWEREIQYQGPALGTILQNLQNGYFSRNDRGVAQVQRSRPLS